MPSFAKPSGGRKPEPLTPTMEAGSSSRGLRGRTKASPAAIDRLSYSAGESERFFVYGFAKNERDNIDASDERDFKRLAKVLLTVSDNELEALVDDGKYVEVVCDGKS